MKTLFGVPASAGRGNAAHRAHRRSLRRVSVITTPEAEEAVAELLSRIVGQPATTWSNLETGVSTVTAYVPQAFRLKPALRQTILDGVRHIRRCGLKTGPGKVIIAKLRHADWAELWKCHFRPIEIGRELLVKPSWCKKRPRNHQVLVVLDPGLSFGTGQHPTTVFCLRELVRHVRNRAGPSFLDMGTGSGILAIAAAKLGYKPVHAFDLDQQAVRVARANARANGVHRKLRISRGDVTKLPIGAARQYDLICANLQADLRIARQLHSHGTLVLAGILETEFARVRRAYSELGLELAVTQARNKWRSGSFRCAE